jgi:hypothetical protein
MEQRLGEQKVTYPLPINSPIWLGIFTDDINDGLVSDFQVRLQKQKR